MSQVSLRKATKSSPWSARLASACLDGTARLPISWVHTLGRTLGHLVGRVPNQQRAITELNLELCFPELSAGERRQLARKSLAETGKMALELGPMWRWPAEKLAGLEARTEGEELLREGLEAGDGLLLLAPHLGNWEFLNHFLMRRAQLVSLYRPPRIAELDQVVLAARSRTGCVSAPATRGGVRQILRTLRSAGLVLILPDQEPLKANGVLAPFFGIPALTMTLVARILRRTGARPLFVFAQRQSDGQFRVCFQKAPEGMADEDEVTAATQLNLGVETCVRRCPEQYLWSYKRFKTAPPGQATPYKAIWSRRQVRRDRAACAEAQSERSP